MARNVDLVLTCEFEAQKYPFWTARRVITTSLPLAARGGHRSSVVAVRNLREHDYRLKIWLAGGVHQGDLFVELNGYEFGLEDKGRGFFTSDVPAEDLRNVLFDVPADDENEDVYFEPGPYLDACVETVFSSQDQSRMWVGDVSGFPAWMRARSIEMTPPDTGGGWHQIKLDAPGINPYRDDTTIPAIRVNGVWCLAMPLVDEWDEQNRGSWGGRWMLTCAPDDLEVIRQGLQELDTIDDEPIPPRSVWAAWSVGEMVGLSRAEHDSWKRDIKDLRRAIYGMSSLKGQMDFVSSKNREAKSAMVVHERNANMFASRSDAKSQARSEEERQKFNARNKVRERESARLSEMRVRYAELNALHDAALEGCLAREMKYATAIAQLFPDVRA